MKPDLSLFPILSDDAMYSIWYKGFQATAQGTTICQAANFGFTPQWYEFESFQNQIRWMFTVLWHCVRTTEGRDIMHTHLPAQDGRTALWDLCQHYKTSTAAKLRAREIMANLVNTPLTSSWSKPLVDYISWFGRTVVAYNKLMDDPGERLTPSQIRTMLERNVSRSSKLADVSRMELMDLARGGQPFSLDQYVSLLKSAAATVDRQLARSSSRPSRRGNAHDGDWATDAVTDGDDTQADTYSAFQVDFQAWVNERNSENRVDEKTWGTLSADTRKKWATMDSKEKNDILASLLSTKRPSRPSLSANVASTDSADAPATTDDTATASREVNSTETKSISSTKGDAHPGALPRMMGSTKTPSNSKPSRAANKASWSLEAHTATTRQSNPSDEWGGIEADTSSESPVPPSFNDSSAVDELDLWGLASSPSPPNASPPDPASLPSLDALTLKELWEADDAPDFW